MMQTGAERFFFFLFWKMFFCVVSDGKRKKEKHASSIGSSTGGPFFFFVLLFFCRDSRWCDTCSVWRDTDLKGPRWSFKVTVATYCTACVCETTCRWNKCVKTQVQGKSQRTPAPTQHLRRRRLLACCAINKSAAALCVRRRRNYCKQTRRAFKMTDRPRVCVRCGQILLNGTSSREGERVETVGTRSW